MFFPGRRQFQIDKVTSRLALQPAGSSPSGVNLGPAHHGSTAISDGVRVAIPLRIEVRDTEPDSFLKRVLDRRKSVGRFLRGGLDLDVPILELPMRAMYLGNSRGDWWAIVVNPAQNELRAFDVWPMAAILMVPANPNDQQIPTATSLSRLRIVSQDSRYDVAIVNDSTSWTSIGIKDVTTLYVEPLQAASTQQLADAGISLAVPDDALEEVAATSLRVSLEVDLTSPTTVLSDLMPQTHDPFGL